MNRRLVLLHGWGADGDDLRPLGDALKARLGGSLDLVTLDAPELHPQGSGRQWYGLFPADWDAVPAAVSQLQQRLHQLHGGIELIRTRFAIVSKQASMNRRRPGTGAQVMIYCVLRT